MRLSYWWLNEEWFVAVAPPSSATTAAVLAPPVVDPTRGWSKLAPVSVSTRLNRVYPQVDQQAHIPFIWRIQSEFPFYLASGSGVFIRSSVTEALY